jgi:hypothetical protein
MEQVQKIRNGHQMSITIFYEQGGAQEELSLWCHTCDPAGNDTDEYDLQNMTLEYACFLANRKATMHSEVYA